MSNAQKKLHSKQDTMNGEPSEERSLEVSDMEIMSYYKTCMFL